MNQLKDILMALNQLRGGKVWDKVFKNGPSKIFKNLSFTNFSWSILSPILTSGRVELTVS